MKQTGKQLIRGTLARKLAPCITASSSQKSGKWWKQVSHSSGEGVCTLTPTIYLTEGCLRGWALFLFLSQFDLRDLSYPTRDGTHGPCSEVCSLNDWATSKVPKGWVFNFLPLAAFHKLGWGELCRKFSNKELLSWLLHPLSSLQWAPPCDHSLLWPQLLLLLSVMAASSAATIILTTFAACHY